MAGADAPGERWELGPRDGSAPALTAGEVHVWAAGLDGAAPRWGPVLDDAERARADRLRFERDRARFVAARGVLRALLCAYAGAPSPRAVRLEYGAHGKPALAGGPGAAIRFSVSHSGGLAVYAVARLREVGVDVERVRPELAGEDVAERFFSVDERAALRALPGPERVEAFFRCWTRKEAYLKARGTGLSTPLDAFSVPVGGESPAPLAAHRTEPAERGRWTLHLLAPRQGYVGALCVEGAPQLVRRFSWAAPSLAPGPE